MRELNKRQSRSWSMLGQRGTFFGHALPEIISKYPNSYVITADLGKTSGMERIMNQQNEHFINVGIAEQNLIGVASGLAFEGNHIFATTFATFLTMRCFEQIRHNIGYQMAKVNLIGGGSGFAVGMFGNTHYAYEDVALMRTIPNMQIISPADASEAYYAAWKSLEIKNPTYIRLSDGNNSPIIHTEPYDYDIGKAMVIEKGDDIVLIATGGEVYETIKASLLLKQKKIFPTVINMHTIKPLDTDIIQRYMNARFIFTIEEHSVIGGLGSAVAEYISKYPTHPSLVKIGVQDKYLRPGSQKYVKHQCGIDADGIYRSVESYVRGN